MPSRRYVDDDPMDDEPDDWNDDSFDENDDPVDDDDEGLDLATAPCPYCQAEILEEAIQCPKCGEYISREDAPAKKQPLWVSLTAFVLLVLMLFGFALEMIR